ncbi:MAG: hypothetical protein ACRCXT_16860 [Paraclostridium sp.]
MYNLNRLKDMLVVMEDCVLKLENFNNIYKSIDNVEAKIYMEEGFRGYIRAFQEQLIKYLAHTSKGLYHRKDKMSYEDIIEKHKSVGQLKDVSTDFLLELRKSRNYVAHGYEHPDFQVIYEFYKIYKCEFDKVINCVRNTVYEAQNNELKEERKQQDELYSSLEMAKKLIPLLQGTNEEIANQTGLDINLIKAIRNKE